MAMLMKKSQHQRHCCLLAALPRHADPPLSQRAGGLTLERNTGGPTMPTGNKRSDQIDRRRVLKGAGLAIGAAGATAATGGTAATAASEPKKPQHNGYRESEEVKTYYRLARF